jgi:hypothetical protein
MKIIQMLAGQEDESHILYGLAEDGSLYEFTYATEARKVQRFGKPAPKATLRDPASVAARDMLEAVANPSPEYRFHDGSTQGWKLVCAPGVMAKPVPHDDDPSKCERC